MACCTSDSLRAGARGSHERRQPPSALETQCPAFQAIREHGDLDLDAATWTIPAADTKGDRRHYVPLSSVAVETLAALPRLSAHVFTTDGRTHMTNYAKLKARLEAFITATGGAVDAWRLHGLRRGAATHMVRLGVREELVGRVLNHAAKGVTARVYALHTYGPEKRQALEAWAEEIERAMAVPAAQIALTGDVADESTRPNGSGLECGVIHRIR